MHPVPDGPRTADRLRCALDDSRRLRGQLGVARHTARALVDAFTADLQSYFPGEAWVRVAEATGRSAGTRDRAPPGQPTTP